MSSDSVKNEIFLKMINWIFGKRDFLLNYKEVNRQEREWQSVTEEEETKL